MEKNLNLFLEAIKNIPDIKNEKGGKAHSTTNSTCLDFFSQVGSLRNTDRNANDLLRDALLEDPTLALRIMFYSRDVRGGLGERQTFREMLKYLAEIHPEYVAKNFDYIAECGRYDDWLVLLNPKGGLCHDLVIGRIKAQLAEDLARAQQGEEISLLAKWLPSVNASSKATCETAKLLCRYLGILPVTYRKQLSLLRKHLQIVENNLRTKDYSFPYENVPSKAMFKYRRAFWRNDKHRYKVYLERVKKHPYLMHTATLAPYDIVTRILDNIREESGTILTDEAERAILDVTWKSLIDYTADENAIVVMDGSGSMYRSREPKSISVAMSLAIYFAERCQGAFHNHFISFSSCPKMMEIKGDNIVDKVNYCNEHCEKGTTNLAGVFDVILKVALENHVPQDQLPSKLYIVSDMEFNRVVVDGNDETVYEYAKKKFKAAGYELPQIVFWNVCARNKHYPVRQNEQGVAMVSCFSAQIFAYISGTRIKTPYETMLDILNSPRYAGIEV